MNLQEIDFCDETSDDVFDFLDSLKISRNMYVRHVSELPFGRWNSYVHVCHYDDSISCEVLVNCLGVNNMAGSGNHEPASKEVWAFKVKNGYLVTDELAIYF